MNREWKFIEGYDNKYIVSNHGEIINVHYRGSNKLKYLKKLVYGNYNCVTLINGKEKTVHRVDHIVAQHFIQGYCDGLILCHIDGDKLNDRVDNIELLNDRVAHIELDFISGREWRDIVGYEGLYKVSSLGEVRVTERIGLSGKIFKGKIVTSYIDTKGYVFVRLNKDGIILNKRVHRLVAEAFIPNTNNLPEVDHIDTNKENNTVHNLRWVTPKENSNNPISIENHKKASSGKTMVNGKLVRTYKDISVYKNGHEVGRYRSFRELERSSIDDLKHFISRITARKYTNLGSPDQYGFTYKLNN